jgi:hypothetical protein
MSDRMETLPHETWRSDTYILKLLTAAVAGAIAVFIWWRLWAFMLTHLGYRVLTSNWFVSSTDMKHDPTHANKIFFALFDSSYACIGGLLVSAALGYCLRLRWPMVWAVFLGAVAISVRELASTAPEVDTYMLRFPIAYAFALTSALGFFAGSRLSARRESISNTRDS